MLRSAITGWASPAAVATGVVTILGGLALGLSLALTPTESLVAVLVALGVLIILILWKMPRPLVSTDHAMWRMFIIFVGLFCLYPSYIPLRLPGLPWIDPIRVAAALLLLQWIYSAFASRTLMPILIKCVREDRVLFAAFGLFVAAQVVSIPVAVDVPQAITRFSFALLYWSFMILAVSTLINSDRRVNHVLTLLVICAALQSLIGFVEAYRERIIWVEVLPPGFGSDNEFIQRVLQGSFRFEVYRVQNSFTVSLVYAEFLVLILPFALHYAFEGRRTIGRIASGFTALIIIPAQYFSGSRLGTIGVIVILGLYALLYIVRRWQQDRQGVVGALSLIMLPWIVIAAVGVFAASPRVQVMILGGDQHQGSNDGRSEQWDMGLPKIASRPVVGHGVGLGAEALGFTNLGGELTIDSYFLSLLLELGLLGFIPFIVMWVWAIWVGIRMYFTAQTVTGRASGAIACSLVAFLIIKSVLAQVDNHALVFIMLALLLALKRLEATAVFSGRTLLQVNNLSRRQRPHDTSRLAQPPLKTVAKIKSSRTR